MLQMMKIDTTCPSNLVNAMCKFIREVLLPQPNCFPSSLYMLEQVCDVPSVDKFEKY